MDERERGGGRTRIGGDGSGRPVAETDISGEERASRREEEKRLVAWKEPVSSVSYVVSVKSDGNRRVSRPPRVIGAHGAAEGGRDSGTTRAFSCSVCAPRSIRALPCLRSRGISPQSVKPLRKMGESRRNRVFFLFRDE